MNLDSNTLAPEAESIVRQIGIPPCPQVLVQLGAEMRAEETDLNRVCRLISSDAGLAAAMLKLTNSPFYGFRNKATTINAALFAIGLRPAGNLVAGMMLRRAFASLENAAMADFWDRTSKVGLTTAYLGREFGLADIDEAHTFALFRDCGQPLLLQKFPDYDAFMKIGSEQRDPTTIERSRYRVDHASIGASLAISWHLPENIWHSIQAHHARQHPPANAGIRCGAPETLIALGELADCMYMAHRGVSSPDQIKQQEHDLLSALGAEVQDLEPLRSDIARILDSA